jgi:hypothetical protein
MLFKIKISAANCKYLSTKMAGKPIDAILSDCFGSWIWLQGQSKKHDDFLGKKIPKSSLTDVILVDIDEYHYSRRSELLNFYENLNFDEYVKTHFYNELLVLAQGCLSQKLVVGQFMKKYDLTDDDVNVSSLLRTIQRAYRGDTQYVTKPYIFAKI